MRPLASPLIWRIRGLEKGLWIGVVGAAFALRVWQLGDRPLQYDEGQVAYFSWQFLQTGEFRYNPILHGPLTYQLEALSLLVGGASDAVARMVPALAGTAVVALPLAVRRQLGAVGALSGALLLAVSPAFLYYSRFDREDILVTALLMGLVVVGTRMFERPRAWHPALAGGLLAASFGTKESTFITVAIVGAALAAAQVGGWPVLRALAAPGRRAWLAAAAVFVLVFVLIFSTFFTHPAGVVDGIYRGPKYWSEQHGVNRGGEAWPLYSVMLVAQEWLALLLGAVGGVVAVRRRHAFGLFSLWLFAASLAVYSYAGERFAWLVLQPLLPLILLAGIGAQALSAWAKGRRRTVLAIAAAAAVALTTWSAVGASFTRGTDPRELLVVVHTAPETRDVRDRVLALAREQPGLRVVVDTAEHSGFPWAWWFRDLDAGYIDMQTTPGLPDADVFLMSEAARDMRAGELRGFTARTFVQRRFWGRDYSRLSPASLGRWAFTREPWSATGQLRSVLLVRPRGGQRR